MSVGSPCSYTVEFVLEILICRFSYEAHMSKCKESLVTTLIIFQSFRWAEFASPLIFYAEFYINGSGLTISVI